MENFIEKLKTVDKKVWIGVGIGAAVLIILIVALAVAGGNDKKPNTNTQGTQYGTETEAGTTEVFGTEILGTEMATETEIATETEMGTETEMTETEGQSQNQNNSGNGDKGETTSNVQVERPDDVNGVEQTPITTTPEGEEILGLGSAEQPYEIVPDSSMTFTTVEVPAGKTLYYSIMKIGGMYLNINDSDMYVIDSAGNRHDSGFTVENAMANEYVSLQIGNKGSSNKTFTISFSNVKGSYMNPEKLEGNGPFSKHLNAGDEKGYYFKMNAAQAGQAGMLYIYMEATAETEMNVQNNSSEGTVARSFSVDYKTDSAGKNYIEIPVNAGDEILIHVQAIKPVRGGVPATDITFSFMY